MFLDPAVISWPGWEHRPDQQRHSPFGEEGADKSGANHQGKSLLPSDSAPLAEVLQCGELEEICQPEYREELESLSISSTAIKYSCQA